MPEPATLRRSVLRTRMVIGGAALLGYLVWRVGAANLLHNFFRLG